MSTFWGQLREWLRRVLLRGPILNWWVGRRARQWERAYCGELVRAIGGPAPSFTAATVLRTILFIGDCMWEQNDLMPELRKIADVTVLDLGPKLKARPDSQSAQACVAAAVKDFADTHARLAPDAIFFYARPALLSDEVFDELRRRWHGPLLGMSLDDKFEFFPYGIFSGGGDNYQRWAKRFDVNLTNCLAATEWYHQRGLPCLYVPQGVHRPEHLDLPKSVQYQHTLSFLGSRKPERALVINRLIETGISIELFGAGWPNSQWIEDPNSVYRNTQINLGIGFASSSSILTTIKGRDFECPGVGACYLTTYNWELTNHYELGKEILCYRSVEELIEMYSWYRKRPQECLRIAQAAWRRCANEHTWEKRFRKVFLETGFKLLR